MRHFQAENISRKIIPNSASLHGDVSIHLCTLRSKISTSSGNGKFETKKKRHKQVWRRTSAFSWSTRRSGDQLDPVFQLIGQKQSLTSSFPRDWKIEGQTKPTKKTAKNGFPHSHLVGQKRPSKKPSKKNNGCKLHSRNLARCRRHGVSMERSTKAGAGFWVFCGYLRNLQRLNKYDKLIHL